MRGEDELRKKIARAGDLHDIVRMMKALSAAGMRHYEKAVESIAEYYGTVELGLQAVLAGGPVELQTARDGEEGGMGAVLFGSDQGLCGGFNDHAASRALKVLREAQADEGGVMLLCVGARACGLVREGGGLVDELLPMPQFLNEVTPLVQRILMKIETWREEGRIRKVLLIHNRPLSGMAYEPRTVRLLPLKREWFRSLTGRKWPTRMIPAFTMERGRLFSALLRQYLFAGIFRAAVESMASENAARLAAMQAAEKNIGERLDELGFLYRTTRQNSITDELLDIVSGFEALEGGG